MYLFLNTVTQEIVSCFCKIGAHVGTITPERRICGLIFGHFSTKACVFLKSGDFCLFAPNKYINVPQSNLHGINLWSNRDGYLNVLL